MNSLRFLTCVVLVIGLLVLPVCVAFWMGNDVTLFTPADPLEAAQQAMQSGQQRRAMELLRQHLQSHPQDREARQLYAECLLQLELDGEARHVADSIQPRGNAEARELIDLKIRCDLAMGDFAAAEAEINRALNDAQRSDSKWQQYRAILLHAQHRFFEVRQISTQRIPSDDISFDELLIYSGYRDPFRYAVRVNVHGNDKLMQMAQSEMNQGHLVTAQDLLKKVIREQPTRCTAVGWYGQILARQHADEWVTWNRVVAPRADDFTEIWLARALAAQATGQLTLSAKCLDHVLLQEPLHFEAAHIYADVVAALAAEHQHPTDLPNIGSLLRLEQLLNVVAVSRELLVMRDIAQEFLKLNRPHYASAWALLAKRLNEDAPWADEILHAANGRSDGDAPSRALIERVAHRPPEFDWNSIRFPELAPATTDTGAKFRDVSLASGIHWNYQNGSDPEVLLGHILETTGGGVGVLDFDRDGRCDLYLAQGTQQFSRRALSDVLYRRISETMFEECAPRAEISETSFSQGVCVGDYNNDGFPDVFLCNFGENRLFENLGDGTFQDVTRQTGVSGNQWSLSAAMTDLNGDSHPDLYVVNYLDARHVQQIECQYFGKTACPPTRFSGSVDQVLLNLGNGEFRDLTGSSGVSDVIAKGMGVVIGDFDGDNTKEIFVGNDGESNLLWKRTSETSLPRYENQALQLGLATSATGEQQASMGIAAGDLNNDGRTDLFVANFYGEDNTAYINQGELFADQIVKTGMQPHSQFQLGFGTQLLDADLDGDLDLMVANGHVERSEVSGELDRMRPQLFTNLGQGSFQLAAGESVGQYFTQLMLGRAVARLDWNADGRPDLAVTHLDRHFALLQNETDLHGHFVCLRLVGTTSERDALGAKVTVTTPAQSWTHQLLAGDGYEVTNQKLLTFGLGAEQVLDEVQVSWPSGTVQTYRNVSVDRTWLLQEGAPRPLLIP